VKAICVVVIDSPLEAASPLSLSAIGSPEPRTPPDEQASHDLVIRDRADPPVCESPGFVIRAH
jgi:hypothetical protein